MRDASGLFYCWHGERPLDMDSPLLCGTGEIRLESAERASGYWTTRTDSDPKLNVRTAGIYWRADPGDLEISDGRTGRLQAVGTDR